MVKYVDYDLLFESSAYHTNFFDLEFILYISKRLKDKVKKFNFGAFVADEKLQNWIIRASFLKCVI